VKGTDVGDAVLARILVECEAAGRRGEADFSIVWRRVVTDRRARVSYINQATFDAAQAAWERGHGAPVEKSK